MSARKLSIVINSVQFIIIIAIRVGPIAAVFFAITSKPAALRQRLRPTKSVAAAARQRQVHGTSPFDSQTIEATSKMTAASHIGQLAPEASEPIYMLCESSTISAWPFRLAWLAGLVSRLAWPRRNGFGRRRNGRPLGPSERSTGQTEWPAGQLLVRSSR